MPMWGQAPLTTFGAGMRLVHAPTTGMLIFPRERNTFPDESGKSEDARNGRQGHLPDGFGPDRVL